VYNSFIVPLFQIAWGSDGSRAEIACQMAMTLVLTPYEILATFFGLKGGDLLMTLAGEFEGSLVEMTTTAADGMTAKADDEDEDEDAEGDGDGGEKKDASEADAPAADGVGVGVAAGVGIGTTGVLSATANGASKQVMLSPDASSKPAVDEENEDEEAEEALRGPVSGGAKKRMKRAEFLARVRSRRAAKQGKNTEDEALP